MTLSSAEGDEHLTVTGYTGSQVSFTVAAHFAGTATITYKVSDGTSNASGSITVTIPDEAPVVTVIGANPLVIAYGSSFTDPGASAIDAVDGTLTVSTAGSVDTTVAGDHTLTYSATDSAEQTSTATRVVTVSPAPAPVAVADRYFTASTRKTPLVLHVLENDTTSYSASLTIVGVTTPKYGQVTIASDGQTLTYTPRVAFATLAATDSFSYTVRDNFGATAEGQVTIGNSARQLKGLYDGLLSDGAATVGYLQVTLTSSGAWTGVLKLGTVATRIRGQFDLENRAAITVAGRSLTLQMAETGEGKIAADFGTEDYRATLTRAPFNATTHRTPDAGKYTFLLPSPGGGTPDGTGYATLKVSAAGVASFAGKCGDGTAWTASGHLKEGEDPMVLYTILNYRPAAGTLAGLVTFRDKALMSDCDGLVAWFKPPQTGAVRYPGGFSATISAIGSRYAAASSKPALAFSKQTAGVGHLDITGADLAAPIADTFVIHKNNIVSETSTPRDRLSLKINNTSGLFSGSLAGHFLIGGAASERTSSFRGVLFQKQSRGEGQFMGPAQVGLVRLTAE